MAAAVSCEPLSRGRPARSPRRPGGATAQFGGLGSLTEDCGNTFRNSGTPSASSSLAAFDAAAAARIAAPGRAGARLGELLVGEGLVTTSEVKRALTEQRKTGGDWARSSLKRGLASVPSVGDGSRAATRGRARDRERFRRRASPRNRGTPPRSCGRPQTQPERLDGLLLFAVSGRSRCRMVPDRARQIETLRLDLRLWRTRAGRMRSAGMRRASAV